MYLTTEDLCAAARSIRVLHAAPLLRSPYAGGPPRLEAVSAQVAFGGDIYALSYEFDPSTGGYSYVGASSRGELARLLHALAGSFAGGHDDLFALETMIHAATRPARRAVEQAVFETGFFQFAA